MPETSVTSWSATQIDAIVPVGAGPGPVSVTVAGLSAQSSNFIPTTKSEVTDSLGNVSDYEAAVAGGVSSVSASDGSGCSSCSVRGVNSYVYDAFGNATSITDPLGNTTTYTYDSSNNLLSESKVLDSTHTATTSYTYNTFGEVLTVTDALGNVTKNTYDSYGNLASVTTPVPATGVEAKA